jgi:hypothetical protein
MATRRPEASGRATRGSTTTLGPTPDRLVSRWGPRGRASRRRRPRGGQLGRRPAERRSAVPLAAHGPERGTQGTGTERPRRIAAEAAAAPVRPPAWPAWPGTGSALS